jgi:hypothetical protein
MAWPMGIPAGYFQPPGFWLTRTLNGSYGTDTRQGIRVSLIRSEPSPALDMQLNTDHAAHWTPAPTLTPYG